MAKKNMSFDVARGIVSDDYMAQVGHCSDIAELKAKVVDAKRKQQQIRVNEADDAQLTAARELARDLGKSYTEQAKTEEANIVVCLNRLRELGDG